MLVYCDTGITEDSNTGETAAMQTTGNLNMMTLLTSFITATQNYSFQWKGKHVQPDIEELYIPPSGCRECVPALIRNILFRRADREPDETTSVMLQLGLELV